MEITLFTLCDGVFNYKGKLTIVGTLDGIYVRELPTKCNLNIALKITVEPQKTAITERLSMQITNPFDEVIPCDVFCDVPIKAKNEQSYISMSVTMQSIPVDKEGMYHINVSLGNKISKKIPFFVRKKTSDNE